MTLHSITKRNSTETRSLAPVEAPALERLFSDTDLENAGYGSKSRLAHDRMKGVGIPFVYLGNRVRYRESDVLAWLDANRRTHSLQLGRGHNRGRKPKAAVRARPQVDTTKQLEEDQ
jgi:hypothetical protein